jgi:hypothetical protein
MKLARMRLVEGESPHIAGETLFDVPKGTLIHIRRSDEDRDVWILYAIPKLNFNPQKTRDAVDAFF